jgi:hypothetical protein
VLYLGFWTHFALSFVNFGFIFCYYFDAYFAFGYTIFFVLFVVSSTLLFSFLSCL